MPRRSTSRGFDLRRDRGGHARGRRRLRRLGCAPRRLDRGERPGPSRAVARRPARRVPERARPGRRQAVRPRGAGRPRSSRAATRAITGLVCERVYFAAERGLCLASQPEPARRTTPTRSTITGPDFRPRARAAGRRHPDPRADLAGRALGRHDRLRRRPLVRRRQLLDQDRPDRHGDGEGARRPGEGLHRHPGRQAVQGGRLQLLGRDVRAAARALLRDARYRATRRT